MRLSQHTWKVTSDAHIIPPMSPQSEDNFPDILAVSAEGLSPSRLLIHMISLGTNDAGSSTVFL